MSDKTGVLYYLHTELLIINMLFLNNLLSDLQFKFNNSKIIQNTS